MSSFFQTPLFLLLGLLLACLACVVAVLRLRRLRRGYEDRLRQLAERERVATSLHDTLLQSMQGMILRFQGVAHRLGDASAERATIEHILDQADDVLAEGRHQILALRMPVMYADNLSQAFAAAGQSLQENFDTPFRMSVSGDPAAVDPDCGELIYAIGRELLYNTFQHAQAGAVELALVYGCEFLTLCVRDDGRQVAQPPRNLACMRERAARIGGDIDLLNVPGRGTEVLFRVPGEICYQTPRDTSWRHRLAAWLTRAPKPPNRA